MANKLLYSNVTHCMLIENIPSVSTPESGGVIYVLQVIAVTGNT